MTECEYYQQLISQRLDGELTAAQEHELAEHLSRCADCRAVDAAFRALSEGFADSAEDAPADLCENVMGEIRREKSERPTSTARSAHGAACLQRRRASRLSARPQLLLCLCSLTQAHRPQRRWRLKLPMKPREAPLMPRCRLRPSRRMNRRAP